MQKQKDVNISRPVGDASRQADREEFALMALSKAIEAKKQNDSWGKFTVELTWKAGLLQTVDISDQIVYK